MNQRAARRSDDAHGMGRIVIDSFVPFTIVAAGTPHAGTDAEATPAIGRTRRESGLTRRAGSIVPHGPA
ncbi:MULTISPECIES: hypothetical protein [Burkholderia]|uniref:Uncharacterized protein n=1 Tax=Burkholderia savannae TaxID=1637837 RepID=A0ABR5T6D8_9BURK|nr:MULTISPECIES: hypothetical protein [Burkholderia]AOJ72098.1 hypothetical protein WS78_25465 [Burkholderia savannae]AOJ83194.1 hypothetical protein WS86_21070 [Burkholderia savannae]AOK50562.1 hypothetical protein WT60_27630 [Burkholderia sp. MSMB617WGS]KVG50078.1 hypothetical protein WS77_23950 [Burkholderia sp. MSMB0265]KVG80812.1 hypothetical protein WS81_12250 [Burkholderia sp. MSMB2040]